MAWLQSLQTVTATAVVLTTVLPWWRHDAWWVRACEFPRVQITVFGLAVLASYGLRPSLRTTDLLVLAALALCLAYQLYRIFPYTPLAPRQALPLPADRTGAHLSLLVANVLMDNRRADGLIEHVRQSSPDLVFTLETDDWWAEQLRELDADYPHTVEYPLANTYGMKLQSRLELVEPAVRFLVEDGVPSIHTRVRLADGQQAQLHLLHPKPPYPAESLETTERDGELLLVGREVGRRDFPTVVAGDLNDVAWSYTTRLLQKSSGLLDPRVGRGLYSTFHAQIPLLRWPLDHVFHSRHFHLVRIERLAAFGSDHFPILVELALDPVAPRVQDEPTPTPHDLEQVEEKIEQAEPLQALPDGP